jgi:hypothetical protein
MISIDRAVHPTGDTTETDENLPVPAETVGGERVAPTSQPTAPREEAGREDRRRRLLLEKRQRKVGSYLRFLQKKGFRPETMFLGIGLNSPRADYIRRRVDRFAGLSVQQVVAQSYTTGKGQVRPYSPMHLLYDIRRGYWRDPRPFHLCSRWGTRDLTEVYDWFIELPAEKDGGRALGALLQYLQSGKPQHGGDYLQVCQALGIRPHPVAV